MAKDVGMIIMEDLEEVTWVATRLVVVWVNPVILMHKLAQIVTMVVIMETLAAIIVCITQI